MWCQKRDPPCRRQEPKGYFAHGGEQLELDVETCIRIVEGAQKMNNDDGTEWLPIVGTICEAGFQRTNEEAEVGTYVMEWGSGGQRVVVTRRVR